MAVEKEESTKNEGKGDSKEFLLDGGDVWLSADFRASLGMTCGARLDFAREGEQIVNYRHTCQRFEGKSLAGSKGCEQMFTEQFLNNPTFRPHTCHMVAGNRQLSVYPSSLVVRK